VRELLKLQSPSKMIKTLLARLVRMFLLKKIALPQKFWNVGPNLAEAMGRASTLEKGTTQKELPPLRGGSHLEVCNR
jgi:hypothetical protein